MAINSKAKGKRAELEVAAILREYGYTDARRGVQYHGGPDSPDIVGALLGVHIEVKHVERLNLIEAMEQADRDSGDNMPVVMHRKNRTPWLVTMHLDDFMTLYKRGSENGHGNKNVAK